MREMDVSRPPTLRLISFGMTTIGGLLVGLGSLLTWADVHLEVRGVTGNALTSNVQGVDTAEGKVALALGFVLLVGGVLMRGMASRSVARIIAWIVVVSGLGAAGIAIVDII